MGMEVSLRAMEDGLEGECAQQARQLGVRAEKKNQRGNRQSAKSKPEKLSEGEAVTTNGPKDN